MFLREKQEVSAGQQFDRTAGKGKFEWTDISGVQLLKVALSMGSESKSWYVWLVNSDGEEELLEVNTGINESVIVLGMIPLANGDRIEIETSGATSDMSVVAVWRDEPETSVDR